MNYVTAYSFAISYCNRAASLSSNKTSLNYNLHRAYNKTSHEGLHINCLNKCVWEKLTCLSPTGILIEWGCNVNWLASGDLFSVCGPLGSVRARICRILGVLVRVEDRGLLKEGMCEKMKFFVWREWRSGDGEGWMTFKVWFDNILLHWWVKLKRWSGGGVDSCKPKLSIPLLVFYPV